MIPTWRTFLQDCSAVIDNDCVIHFGDITTELSHTQTDTVMVDLSHFGLISFSGEEAQSFLQRQLSCDVRKVNLHTAQYGSYCTPKGRILTSFLLWQNEDFLMQLPASLCAYIQKRLSMFVLRTKVQLTDYSDTWVRIGLAGKHASMLVEEISDAKLNPAQHLSLLHSEPTSIICYTKNRFELITSIENAPVLWTQLNQYAKPAGAACWDWLEIHAGIPIILPITQEQFVPQMVNLDTIGGVSFEKGCYPGQEIVARTQHLGKIKRRMYLANIPSKMPVSSGDELFSSKAADQSCGKIVNAAPSPDGGFDVLAVIQVSSVEAGEIHWQALDGPILEIMELPYSLNS